MDLSKLEKLVSVAEAAEFLGITKPQLRRLTKKDKVPGAVKILGRVGYDLEQLKGFEVPEIAARAVSRREDGRSRYNVYMTAKELAAFQKLFPELEVIDPRTKRAERRAAKKAKSAGEAEGVPVGKAVAEEVEDAFGDFDA